LQQLPGAPAAATSGLDRRSLGRRSTRARGRPDRPGLARDSRREVPRAAADRGSRSREPAVRAEPARALGPRRSLPRRGPDVCLHGDGYRAPGASRVGKARRPRAQLLLRRRSGLPPRCAAGRRSARSQPRHPGADPPAQIAPRTAGSNRASNSPPRTASATASTWICGPRDAREYSRTASTRRSRTTRTGVPNGSTRC
jgi:hypothetical protein